MNTILALPHVYSVIAEEDGRIVGSNFLWEGDAIAGVGPITVDPRAQTRQWQSLRLSQFDFACAFAAA